ncbi:phage tail protein [uncultured Selenomonas sp.]|uniref:phage tail protein n=1 Tax=uncultured Selenomonas sp. TaxID=159275 RepID=UPI002676BD99|nr:phage tail protein [uncultured Selenomonas sp.]
MAQFPILRLTRAGQDLAGMSQGGGKLIFVRAELGDGQLGEGESVEMLHTLKRRVMQLPLQGYLNEGNGKARLRFVVDNSSLTAGFFNREIGIVAKMEGGDEQLYAYTNAGNYADYIPSKDTPIDSEIIDLHILIGNASHIVLETQNGAYATKIELEEHRTAAELDHPEKSVHKKHLHQDAYESPALTGTPTAPTAGKGTNNGQIASTAFVAQAIAALVNSAPGALDTLQELAAALGNDADFAATVTNALAGKVSKSGDTMTGPLDVPILDVRSGFFGDYKRDSGDAIEGNGGANVNVGSWYGIGFYDTYNKKYTGSMNLRTGDWRTLGKIRADQGFVGDLAGTADNANKLGGQSLQWIINQINVAKTSIAILTGVLNDGGTIPLPDGYTESQCRWMVSPKSDNYNLSTWDIDESGGQKLIYTFYCHTEGRKVVCRSRHVGDDGDRTFLGSVNYMIIGVK